MDTQRDPRGPAEENWIEKYRAALDAIPVPQSRWDVVRESLEDVREILRSHLDNAVQKAIRALTSKRAVRAELGDVRIRR
jgi:hypothetical protein